MILALLLTAFAGTSPHTDTFTPETGHSSVVVAVTDTTHTHIDWTATSSSPWRIDITNQVAWALRDGSTTYAGHRAAAYFTIAGSAPGSGSADWDSPTGDTTPTISPVPTTMQLVHTAVDVAQIVYGSGVTYVCTTTYTTDLTSTYL